MTEVISNVEQTFYNLHDNYVSLWEEAMGNGQTQKVEEFYDEKSYKVTVFTNENAEPLLFNYKQSIDGLRQSVKALIGAEKRFENRVVRLKNEFYSYVFYEMVILQENKEITRIFTTEEWKKIDGNWKISNEVNTIIK
ncbi:hypothetical protein [Sutcliffiella rhizosphaerae]|uniref:DUF4440 domain-containing protein n=1 Tax=Sutcliffiella rhizosphaerae TaxID=2880967 RepID=A0ABM8YUT3_9BACI|nr:hypothetical protein [Sutcliffiella rhizosphaerae]CAG9623744.1 hypothetical protein BACCIP111883_04576 [Sutcliffiella rhizosphaerae]